MEKVFAIITTAISTISALYNFGYKKVYKKEYNYYLKLLSPFMQNYQNNRNINAVKFCKRIIKYTDKDIPLYIQYLIREKEDQKLKKVLLFDYFDLYESDDNIIKYTLRVVTRMIMYILMFFSIIFIIIGCASIGVSISLFLSLNNDANFLWLLFGVSVLVISIIILLLSKNLVNERYSIRKKIIEKEINRKVKEYDKNSKKYFF